MNPWSMFSRGKMYYMMIVFSIFFFFFCTFFFFKQKSRHFYSALKFRLFHLEYDAHQHGIILISHGNVVIHSISKSSVVPCSRLALMSIFWAPLTTDQWVFNPLTFDLLALNSEFLILLPFSSGGLGYLLLFCMSVYQDNPRLPVNKFMK